MEGPFMLDVDLALARRSAGLQFLDDNRRGATTLRKREHLLALYIMKRTTSLTPLQIAAAPYSPALRPWMRVTTMREPELPSA